jgi:hypothetical protein
MMCRSRIIDLFGPLLSVACALAVAGCVQGTTHEMDGTGGAAGAGAGGTKSSAGGSGAGGMISSSGGATGAGGATGSGGATGAGGKTGSGGATGSGGGTAAGGATGAAGQTGNGQPAILTAFSEDFEDGSFTAPPAKWLSTVRSDGDIANWAIATDGTKVASQSLAADETELVSGDYRWTDSAIEAKVKLRTPDARAGVCVRWKNKNNKYCVYLEQLADAGGGVVNWAMELRMRSDLGSASSLPKVKSKDLIPVIPASLTGWNTVKLEVHGSMYTASLNGMMVFQFADSANLVTTGGIALATSDGGIAEFDDAVATPF